MSNYELSFKRFGESAILIEWPQIIHKDVLNNILNFKQSLLEYYKDYQVYLNHAYCSLLINYETYDFKYYNEVKVLKDLYNSNKDNLSKSALLWKVPVCYDSSFGIDLEELSEAKKLNVDDIINLHTKVDYLIYFVGFLPGFLYLGGLEEVLHTPRRATPRLNIAKGAVAIGGKQTGVYPSQSPGGWHIIGNSPINFFNIEHEKPCFAQAGDFIKFYSVTTEKFREIKTLVEAGVYQLESEIIND
ncbi:5-oxoprolinase subunit PxpB [Hyunsoonleella aestuarii]|uniref:5-oxoprolinase subunit PxpB n=1 Tax=Hyunsoonleella aestuarii TaxID=912802 RepID=A0ABP8EDD6_9FLAO|nr:5-oxoprolinase subunit PxpB [Hyunsoonleella aestuarii]